MAPKKQQYLSSPAPKQDDPQDNGGTVFDETSEYNGTEDVEDVKSVGKQPKMLVRHLSAKNETNETRRANDTTSRLTNRSETAETPQVPTGPSEGRGRIGGKMVSVEQMERMRSVENGTGVTYEKIGHGDDWGLL